MQELGKKKNMINDIGIGSVKNEWILNTFFLTFALALSIYIWKRRKNLLMGILIFSLLGNLVFYTDSGSLFYSIYHLKWIVKFTLWYWPWINLVLLIFIIINFIKNKYVKTK